MPALDRRRFLKASTLALAATLDPARTRADGPQPGGSARPNLVLFLADDMHRDAIGYASSGKVITPHLDGMAAAGTVFGSAYCSAIPCTPSRGSIMSGRHHHHIERTGPGDADSLRPGEWTWAHALSGAGYQTALIGKMHFEPMRAGAAHGFSHAEYCEHHKDVDDYERWLQSKGLTDWQTFQYERKFVEERPAMARNYAMYHGAQVWPHAPEYHPISWIRNRAIRYLEHRAKEKQPFCLTISFRYPHAPYNPSQSFADLYDETAIAIPTDQWDDMEGLPSGLVGYKDTGWFPRSQFRPEILRRRFAYIYALISQIDDAIGSIMKAVDPSNTTVLFTADHGDYMGQRGRVEKHPWLPFEQVGRVPFLAMGHGVPRGARRDQPISLVDLAPTFLRAAGVRIPGALDGVALQNYFEDAEFGRDRTVYCFGVSAWDAVRHGSYKYFRSLGGKEEMLFDLSSDPRELRNRASDPALYPIRSMMRKQMDAVFAKAAPERVGSS